MKRKTSYKSNENKQIYIRIHCVKVSIFGVTLVYIFPHLDWMRRDMEYLSVFSPNGVKYGPE